MFNLLEEDHVLFIDSNHNLSSLYEYSTDKLSYEILNSFVILNDDVFLPKDFVKHNLNILYTLANQEPLEIIEFYTVSNAISLLAMLTVEDSFPNLEQYDDEHLLILNDIAFYFRETIKNNSFYSYQEIIADDNSMDIQLEEYTEYVLARLIETNSLYNRFIEMKRNHCKWLQKYKLLKWFLVFSELKSFLTIFLLLSMSIIAEENNNVQYLAINILGYSIILMITSYFSKGMYTDRDDLIFSYLKILLGMLLVNYNLFLV